MFCWPHPHGSMQIFSFADILKIFLWRSHSFPLKTHQKGLLAKLDVRWGRALALGKTWIQHQALKPEEDR